MDYYGLYWYGWIGNIETVPTNSPCRLFSAVNHLSLSAPERRSGRIPPQFPDPTYPPYINPLHLVISQLQGQFPQHIPQTTTRDERVGRTQRYIINPSTFFLGGSHSCASLLSSSPNPPHQILGWMSDTNAQQSTDYARISTVQSNAHLIASIQSQSQLPPPYKPPQPPHFILAKTCIKTFRISY